MKKVLKTVFVFILVSFFLISTVYAWETTDIVINNVIINDNNIVGFNISFKLPNGYGDVVGWIAFQTKQFSDGDFTNFGNINYRYHFGNLMDVQNNSEFTEQYGIIGFTPDANEGFPCFGRNTAINQSLTISNVPVFSERTYYIYLWTSYHNQFYPDAYLGKIVLDGSGDVDVYDSSSTSVIVEGINIVRFNTTGGNNIDNQVVLDSNKVIRPQDPVKDNYIFDGWYTDSDYKTAFDFDSLITDSLDLYAKWVQKPVYTVDGNNQIFTLGSLNDILIIASGDLAKLTEIKVNNITLDASNYLLKSGSTKLTLKNSYLNTLIAGTYSIKFVYNDGSVDAALIVVNASNEKSVEKEEIVDNVDTEDIILFCILMLVLSIITIVGAEFYERKKRFD